jgi:membrane protease YdiL (CAAX protease family)
MLWKKTWEPGAVLALLAGILGAFLFGNLAAVFLRQAGVHGFKHEDSTGTIMLITLSFQGAALVLGALFLKFHDTAWREVFGATGWPRCLRLACLVLVAVAPVMFVLKFLSELLLHKLHWSVEDQRAVELILGGKLWVRVYLAFFAVVLAPLAEEFVFRGLLFSTAKHFGRPLLGWFGVSFLFAAFHANAPIFLPLFVLALALTWLYEKTEGLLAPVIAHSLFNAGNLALLFFQGHLPSPS